ncbi:MAG: capsular biosynthesis protein [Salinisphaeraceae bacterium]|nr:capsular biosynthesis protein [Salinisphaeraceae bacterium]
MTQTPAISICIATCRRAERLTRLLFDLAAQTLRPFEIVVVDNDEQETAAPVVEAFRAEHPALSIIYGKQAAERNIATTRNESVHLASGEWLAFIDDDERAGPRWLEQLYDCARQYDAGGVLGPVVPVLPDTAQDWIRAGNFYDFPRTATGNPVADNHLRFGNVLLRAEPVKALPGPFDRSYGLRTGEDGDLLLRMRANGEKIIWCDEAVVEEPVAPDRLSLKWLMQRALSGGQEYARKHLGGRYGALTLADRVTFFLNALGKLLLALLLVPPTLVLGRHRSAQWLIAACANAGKLTVFWGWQYDEYARGSAPP